MNDVEEENESNTDISQRRENSLCVSETKQENVETRIFWGFYMVFWYCHPEPEITKTKAIWRAHQTGDKGAG